MNGSSLTWNAVMNNVFDRVPKSCYCDHTKEKFKNYYMKNNLKLVTSVYTKINFLYENQAELPKREIYELCCIIRNRRFQVIIDKIMDNHINDVKSLYYVFDARYRYLLNQINIMNNLLKQEEYNNMDLSSLD